MFTFSVTVTFPVFIEPFDRLTLEADKGFRPITVRRNVERRILRFSLCFGVLATMVAGFAYVATLRADVRNLQRINQEALDEMPCDVDVCQSNKFTTDPYTDSPDYVVDPKTKYFLSAPGSTPETATRLASLDFVDGGFVKQYHQPDSYNSLDGEKWRLFSRPAVIGSKPVEVIVGYAEKQPTKILEASSRDLPSIVKRLRQEADGIAANLAKLREPSSHAIKSASKFSADGFMVLDANTGEVLD